MAKTVKSMCSFCYVFNHDKVLLKISVIQLIILRETAVAWQSFLGICAFIGFAWIISENRRAFSWMFVVVGLGLQFGLAAALLKIPLLQSLFLKLNAAVIVLQSATQTGTSFVFGYLGGGDLPFTENFPGASFILAFQALPLVLLISALSALLFYWDILPKIIRVFSIILEKSFGLSGAEGVGAAANIFVGMIEAPLLIRPIIQNLSRSQLFLIMTTGMATIAGTMMVLYASILEPIISGALGHILTASIISAPAAIVIAKLMVPANGAAINNSMDIPKSPASGAMDAITRGTADGIGLLISIIAMLIVLVALVSLFNEALALLPDVAGQALTLERFLGWILQPVMWLMGIPWEQTATAGQLFGIKVVLNEFLAYLKLSQLPSGSLDARSQLIMIYALCGFANFGSLGIMIGGLGGMAPERRSEIAALGPKSILSGALSTALTGAIVGTLI